MSFSGITTALVTPFLSQKLDQKSFFNLLEDQTKQGIKSFVLNGTTGESPTLKEEEVRQLCLWFQDFQKTKNIKLNLLLGTGTFSTEVTLEKTKKAEGLGASAVLVVTPYYNKPSQEGLLEHFSLVAKATPLPVILYNVPSRTSSSLELATIKELALIPNIIGIKEASGDVDFLIKIRETCSKDFLFLSGDDFTAVKSMVLGGDGVISVASHVLGKVFLSWFKRATTEKELVLKEFEKYESFLKELYATTNPIGIKQLLKQKKIITSSELRLPLKQAKEKSSLLEDLFLELEQ
ncbi:MAG: 4-hydroxy-tetrahydrodipicolinate synthase [Bdellovibrionales bacterium]